MRNALVVAMVMGVSQLAAAQIPSIPGFQKSRRELQGDAAQKLHPAAIVLLPPEGSLPVEGGPRAIRVRVYAARDYRNQTFNWSSKFRRLVERVNKLVERWPAVRFEIVEVKNWDRDSVQLGTEELLVELEKLDAGRDVDLVIGLIAAVPILPTQIHYLAMARSPGHHFVMRSLHDLAELEALRTWYDELPDDQRDRLLSERKAQKELVVFLHEWGHTLGAIHAVHSDLIMNPQADAQQSRFCPPNAHLIEVALRQRATGGDEAAMRQELAGYIQSAHFADWEIKDRDQLLALYLGRAPSVASTPAPATRTAATFTDGKSALVECDRANRRGGNLPQWRAVEAPCRAAAQLAPDDPMPVLALARAYLDGHLDDKAATALAQAHQRLDYQSAAAPNDWRLLAELYQRASAPANAVEAAAHADAATVRQIAAWATQLRRREALPAGALAADREAAYTRAFELARTAIDEGQQEAAAMLVASVERDYPSLAGALVLRCQLERARKKFAEAEAACDRALAKQEDAVAAHFYLGAMRSTAAKRIAHLTRALELDPEIEPAWRLLARAYGDTHDRAALDRLRADYQKQFHAPLP